MWHYFWWIPSLFIYYFIYYWLSIQNNELGGKWFWIMFVFGALCPLWLFVSRISKNIVFDGMLFDVLLFFVFPFTMIIFGKTVHFNVLQWIGLIIICVGFILLQIDNTMIVKIFKEG